MKDQYVNYSINSTASSKVKKSGIYIYWFDIDNEDNCKRSYIGSTINYYTRKKYHLSKLRNNKHENSKFQRAYNKYGEEKLCYEELEEMKFPVYYSKELVKDHLETRENYWQCKYNCKYIILKGGEYLIHKKLTDLEKSTYNFNRKEIYLVDMNLNIIEVFNSCREASRKLNLPSGNISLVANLKVENTKGFRFRYKDNLNKRYIYRNKKKIICYDINYNIVAKYNSLLEAAIELNINKGCISMCLCNKVKIVAKKYIFKYNK